MPQCDLVLGLDVGTTNIKCLAIDVTGQIVAQSFEPTPRAHPRSDWTDFEPGAIWDAACQAIRAVVAQLERREAIKGIAASSLAESLVPLDAQGQPLAPAIAWFDPRTTPEYEWIRAQVRGVVRQYWNIGVIELGSPETSFRRTSCCARTGPRRDLDR
jgi:sugar (pentulose or hexulose) kinase